MVLLLNFLLVLSTNFMVSLMVSLFSFNLMINHRYKNNFKLFLNKLDILLEYIV